MNHATKQRLTGILVVGCLAAIIIPILLDGEGIQAPPLSTTIPSAPDFPVTTIPEPTRPTIIADTLIVPDSALPEEENTAAQLATTEQSSPAEADPDLPAFAADEEAAPATEPGANAPDALEQAVASIMADADKPAPRASGDSTPRLDSTGLPAAFVVRLGSFGEKTNADALVKQLLDAEYKAYARSVNTNNGVFNAVYVGPVITKAEANDLVDDLSTRFQLKGIVENFTMQSLQ